MLPNRSCQGTSFTSVVSHGFEHHAGQYIWARCHPILKESTLMVGQKTSHYFPFPPATREELTLDQYLQCSMPHMLYTFTNTLAFSRIRTQVLRLCSQHHCTVW
ncbi:hypothetical protein TNCV_2858571 [Trichonephila clavipes]|nr:hypothetical protein TNCV_2858571 [Trichonephila clavipes]